MGRYAPQPAACQEHLEAARFGKTGTFHADDALPLAIGMPSRETASFGSNWPYWEVGTEERLCGLVQPCALSHR